jgi:hypothetical protein
MSEPIATMAFSNAMSGPARETPEVIWMARRDAADVLLLKRPPRFNGIEVRRVRRQIDDADASRSAGGPHAWIVVGGQVVHHDDIAWPQLRQQVSLQPPDEAVLVGGGEHGREHHPSREPDRSEEGEVLAPVHRNVIEELAAAPHPGVAAAHRQVHARLVEKHEPFARDATDLGQVLGTLGDDVRPETLQRPSALFFTT